MFSETQMKARELTLDIRALAEQQHQKLGKLHHISARLKRRADKISDEVDCKGYAEEDELKELSIMLKHLRKWSYGY